MHRSVPEETSTNWLRPPPPAIREAPAIRRFAESDPELVHWSELARGDRGGAAGRAYELLGDDVRTFFGRFG